MSKTRFLTRTAVILALAIIFQNLRYFIGTMPNSNIIIGSLVNLTIIVATGAVGIVSGIIISIVTPIVAFFQGQLPHIYFMPVTMLGNTVLAVIFYIFKRSSFSEPFNALFGVIVGAIAKWAVMYYVGVTVVLRLFVPNLPPQKAAIISAAFNIPQIITALTGGILGIIIVKVLNRKKLVD